MWLGWGYVNNVLMWCNEAICTRVNQWELARVNVVVRDICNAVM